MRFVTARVNGTERPGLVAGNEIVPLPSSFADLVGFIEAGEAALAETARLAGERSAERVPLADAELLAPIRRFRRDVLCTGWNYWDHFEEGQGRREGQDVERPKAPTFFTKSPDAVIGPRDPIGYDPRISEKWDYEAELVVVIGRAGRSIPAARAHEHVFGYCLANDVSQRDLQRRHGGQWLKGKSIDGTTPLGPMIVTPDELDIRSMRLQCFLNGAKMQDAAIAQMAFSIPELISELSFGMTLRPGDILLTGTPSGVGYARNPPVFLKEGDEIVTRADGIGELRNRVVRRDLYGESDIRID